MSQTFTSSTAQLGDGNRLFYQDSGAPDGSTDYTTIVCFHGSSLHAASFEGVHIHAAPNNLRFIIVNRRGYPGSTPYTDGELGDIVNNSKVDIDRRAIMTAYFVKYVVDNLSIPKMSADRKTGGIAVVGWSFGSVAALSLFSDLDIYPKDLYPVLEDNVKDVVIMDPPYCALGIEFSKNTLWDPFVADDLETPEAIYDAFTFWCGSYFNQPHNWDGDIQKLDSGRRTDRCTFDGWKSEEITRVIDFAAAGQVELPMYHPNMQAAIREMTHRAFFKPEPRLFSKVPITYVSYQRTPWHCFWAAYLFRKTFDENVAKGLKVRETRFLHLENANHVAHMDLSEDFLKGIQKGITA